MRNSNILNSEHSIDMFRDNVASSSVAGAPCEPTPQNVTSYVEEQPSSSAIQVPVSQQPPSTAVASSGGGGLMRRNGDGGGYNRRRRSPLNSGLWISIELAVTLCQIIASIVVLSLSRNEKPRTPLFAWIVGYAAGCVATLPLLYWRYIHRNNQGSNQEARNAGQNNVQNNPSPDSTYISITMPPGQEQEVRMSRVWWWRSAAINARLGEVVDHFKMALDCFFAVWFVIGNVWIFGGHSSAADAPNLYRLCIVFLTFSCIGYAMPFILCAAICCCLPCIISILGVREDLGQTKGASVESINALPVYKFKLRRRGSKENGEINSDSISEGGVLAAGTEKERIISGEDAECCICLAKYGDNEELRELPCSHCFHVACVDKWLKINASCPLCKAELEDSLSRMLLNRRSNGRMMEDANRGGAV